MVKRESSGVGRPTVETEAIVRGMTCMCREKARVWCIERGILFEHAFVLGWVADGSVSGMVQGVPAEAAEAKPSAPGPAEQRANDEPADQARPADRPKGRPAAAQMELL